MKRILPLLFVTLLLCSCNSSSSTPTYDNNHKLTREALNAFDTAPYQVKGYEVNFTESYSATRNVDSEDEKSSFTLSYNAEGYKKYSYTLNEGTSYSPLEILSKGTGFYASHQRVVYEYKNSEIDKVENATTEDQVNVTQDHKIGVSFDNSLVNINAMETYRGDYVSKPATGFAHNFEGSIARNTLVNELSDNSLNKALKELTLTDSLTYIDEMNKYFLFIIPEIKNKNDEDLKTFINDNKVEVSKENNNYKVKLDFIAEQLISELEIETSEKVGIAMELTIDNKGQVLSFKYDLKNFLLNLLSSEDSNITVDESSLVFNAEGKLLRSTLDPVPLVDSVEYEEASTFINDFFAKGVPYHG